MSKENRVDVNLSNQHIAQHIVELLDDIRFGSLEILVHDGQVVQIDKHEKYRVKNNDKSNCSKK